MSKQKITFDIPKEQRDSALVELLVEQNARLKVISEQLLQVYTLVKTDGVNMTDFIKDNIAGNNEKIRKYSLEIIARIMNDHSE